MPTSRFVISRRRLLASTAGIGSAIAAAAWGFSRKSSQPAYKFSGGLVGANSGAGHLLRNGIKQVPEKTISIDTAIVGGGIAGLSAAWWLKKTKSTGFKLFEMDREVGGNSSSGQNSVSRYPWGAHYVPVPGADAKYVREFFSEIGLIKGFENGDPIYDEFALCADSHERLFFQGEWHDGVVPQRGVPLEDRRQYDEFFAEIEKLKSKLGRDGRPAFTIPLDLSSRDPELLKLDRKSMADEMRERGWTSKYLNWYVNYCCRDDYGQPHDRVSAWAGFHYFASRSGRGADSQAVLTWPEGNGFLVDQLKLRVSEHVTKNSLVYAIEDKVSHVDVDVLNIESGEYTRYEAKHVIYSGPRFTAAKTIKNYQPTKMLEYAPWAIANVTVRSVPKSRGNPLAWDNVSYYSDSLGYINANHQDLKVSRQEKVFTYYLPLDHQSPREERRLAHTKSYEDWLRVIVPDLEKMHPGITELITNLDVWIWGHGMVSPGIDFLWSERRREYLKPFGRIEFAHSDMSGISIFEEAQYQGVEAARRVLAKGRA